MGWWEIYKNLFSSSFQDTATMLQHPPLVQIPPLCGGKGIKLLNHPVPALREDSPVHRALSDSSLEPLLKSESIL